MRPRARSNSPSLLDSMITGVFLEGAIVLDQRAGLIAVEARHHDVHEDDVGPVVGDLGKRVEAIHGGIDLAAFLGEQGLRRAPDGLAVIDDKDLQPTQVACNIRTHRGLHAGNLLLPF